MSDWIELSAQNSITPMNVELFLKIGNQSSSDVTATWTVTLPRHLTKTTDKPLTGTTIVKPSEDEIVGSWNLKVGSQVPPGNSEVVANASLVGADIGGFHVSDRRDLSQMLNEHSRIGG
jgi:hypothetical protein